MRTMNGNNKIIQKTLIIATVVMLVPLSSMGANIEWSLASAIYGSLSPERQEFADKLCAAENGLVAAPVDLATCFEIAEKGTNMHLAILPRACAQWSGNRNTKSGEMISLAQCAKQMLRADLQFETDHDHVPGDNCSPANSFDAAVAELHKEMREDVAIFGDDGRQEAPLTGEPYSAMGTISCLNMQKNVFEKATAIIIKTRSGEDAILTTAHSFGNIRTGDKYEGCMFKSRLKGKDGKRLITNVRTPILGSAMVDGGWTGDWAVAKLEENLSKKNPNIKPVKVSLVSRDEVSRIRSAKSSEVEMIAYNSHDKNISHSAVEFFDNSNPGDVIYNPMLILTDGDANGGGSGGILFDKATNTLMGIYSGRKDNLTEIDDSNVDGSKHSRENNSNVVIRIRPEIVQAVGSL